MTDYSAITHRLFSEAQRAVETLDRSNATAIQSIAIAIRKAVTEHRERMADIRSAREEAARIVAQSLKDEDSADQSWRDALDQIERALREIAPEQRAMLKAAE